MFGANSSRSVKIAVASVVVVLMSAAFLVGRSSAGGVPSMNPLTYSGTLEDATGARIEGKRNIEIKLWSSANATLCTTSSQPVDVVHGRFSLVLPADCVAAINKEADTEIEVLVGGGTLGRTKLGAVPYALQAGHATSADSATAADRATTADNATTAAGSLDQRLAAIEGKKASIARRATGWINDCQPIGNFAVDGGSNILLRASLYQDPTCETSANDPNQCHFFCASQAFTNRSTSAGCCGIETYYTKGIVETLVIKPGLE